MRTRRLAYTITFACFTLLLSVALAGSLAARAAGGLKNSAKARPSFVADSEPATDFDGLVAATHFNNLAAVASHSMPEADSLKTVAFDSSPHNRVRLDGRDDLRALVVGVSPAFYVGAAQANEMDQPAERMFKNIQVLRGVPARNLYPLMNYIRVSLGVSCDYCHVQTEKGEWVWERDDKRPKESARKMILMAQDINNGMFGGRSAVTCYSCHKGQELPTTVPPLSMIAKMEPSAEPHAETPAAPLPSVAQVLDAYEAAIGGKAAIEKLKTRVLKGTLAVGDDAPARVEIYQEAPNKMLIVATDSDGSSYQGFDGKESWAKILVNGKESNDPQVPDLRRSAIFYKDYFLTDLYTQMRVKGRDRIGDRDTYVVEAVSIDEKKTEDLYFDSQTGLLLRKVIWTDTMVGQFPETIDFDDYEESGGIKLALVRRKSGLGGFRSSVTRFTEVKYNVALDEAKFNATTPLR